MKNPDTPLLKLRQAMRNSCGDYREKMKAEAKDIKLQNEKISAGQVKGNELNFIKKSAVAKPREQNDRVEFKFNFDIGT